MQPLDHDDPLAVKRRSQANRKARLANWPALAVSPASMANEANPEASAVLVAIAKLRQRLDDATTILSNHAKPDGPTCEEAISQLYRVLDTAEFMADLGEAERAEAELRAAIGQDD
jgi:hypothetical protein